MKKIYFLMLSLTVSALYGQKDLQVIDEFAQRAMAAAPMVPSVSIAIVKDDKPVFIKGYGMADPEVDLQSGENTAYYIASITKSFTGLLALVLEDEGMIDLDAPLTNYKPFKDLNNKDLFKEITIRNLLNHTSGIDNGYIVFRDAYTGDKSLETMTMLLEEKTEKRKEGKTYAYDNLGYNIFDILLKSEFDKDWRELLEEKIFSPLRMNNTSAYISKAQSESWEMAWPYIGYYSKTPERSYLMKNDNMMQAAGGLLTTTSDATKWIEMYLNDGMLDGKRIFDGDMIQASLQSEAQYEREGDIFTDNGYGIGWVSADFNGERIHYHFGGFVGFFSHISIMPEKGLGIAAFSNEAAFGDNVSNLIASFAYDYLLGNVDSADDYNDKLKALEKRITKVQASINKHHDEIMARKWKLELPKDKYTGTFHNKYLGTVEVSQVDDELLVKMGTMKAIATPYTEKNSLRVDYGSGGNVVLCKVQNGEVLGIESDGEYFEKVD